jgi:hypothetical protein
MSMEEHRRLLEDAARQAEQAAAAIWLEVEGPANTQTGSVGWVQVAVKRLRATLVLLGEK